VPFALLATAQLLAVGGSLALCASAFRAPLRGTPTSSWLIVAGGLVLAVADGVTGARLGVPRNDVLLVLHAIGLLLLAAGLGDRRGMAGAPAIPGAERRVPSVVPLGAALPVAEATVAAGVLAAVAAWRRPVPGRRVLALGLLLEGGCAVLAPAAGRGAAAAAAMLGLRAVGALAVLAALGLMARSSVLSKVVAVVGVGILATAIATAGVVGTVAADQLTRDQATQVRQAAAGAVADLQSDAATAQQLATLAAGCADQVAAVTGCAASVAAFATGSVFTAVAAPGAAVRQVGGDTRLDTAALLDLGQQQALREALADPGFVGSGFVLLHGAPVRLVALGVASHRAGAQPTSNPRVVVVYGVVVDAVLLSRSRQRSTFDATVLALPGGTEVASSLPAGPAAMLAARARGAGVLARLPASGAPVSRVGEGHAPTVGYAMLPSGTDPVAALALSATGNTVLRTQRLVLELLFTALAVIGLLVAGGAYFLGRRAVEPVLRLTTAARRVGAGDLTVSPQVGGSDEIGQLAEVFAAMTASLRTLTGDLRMTAEQESATRARLTTVLDALGDGLLVSDAAGVVSVANPAAVALVGTAVGRPVDDVLTDPAGVPLAEGEGILAGATGPVPVDLSRAQLPHGNGQVHLVRDVTGARQLARAKTEFLANVSHELRTPLTPLQGYADLLHRRPDLPADTRADAAASLAAASRRLGRVVGLLVDVAALDAGSVAPVHEPVPLGPFVAARLADWRRRSPVRAGDLRGRVAGDLTAVLVDPQWLARAVDELLDNALKYTPPGTVVALVAAPSAQNGRVRLQVRDAGVALDPQAHAAIFVDFAQADGSATRRHEGLGLGLAFVRRVAVVLDAHVGVESTADGTSFWLDLPAVNPDGGSTPGETGPSASSTGLRAASVSRGRAVHDPRPPAPRRGGPPA
jgi:signal transduction histidine kinase/HAMP domain-containing protein